MALTTQEKLDRILAKLKLQGHKVIEVKAGTYRCPQCGRYMVFEDGKAIGAMTNGRCAGGIHER